MFVITDGRLEDMVDFISPPQVDFDVWLSKMPPRPDGKPWIRPASCRPILHKGGVKLVNFPEGHIEPLRTILGTDRELNCYRTSDDDRTPLFIFMLLVDWYLSKYDGTIGLFSDDRYINDETPISEIDVSTKSVGFNPLRADYKNGVLYLFFSSEGILIERDPDRLLNMVGSDIRAGPLTFWYYPKRDVTLSELIQSCDGKIHHFVIYDARRGFDQHPNVDPIRIAPVEVVYCSGFEPKNPINPDIVSLGSSRFEKGLVHSYTMSSDYIHNSHLKGTSPWDDHNHPYSMIVFVELGDYPLASDILIEGDGYQFYSDDGTIFM